MSGKVRHEYSKHPGAPEGRLDTGGRLYVGDPNMYAEAN